MYFMARNYLNKLKATGTSWSRDPYGDMGLFRSMTLNGISQTGNAIAIIQARMSTINKTNFWSMGMSGVQYMKTPIAACHRYGTLSMGAFRRFCQDRFSMTGFMTIAKDYAETTKSAARMTCSWTFKTSYEAVRTFVPAGVHFYQKRGI